MLYFVVLVFFGAFFLLNLVLAVVVDTYAHPDRFNDGEDDADPECDPELGFRAAVPSSSVSNDATSEDDALPTEGIETAGVWRNRIIDVVSAQWFRTLVLTTIILNTIVLAIHYPKMDERFRNVLDGFNVGHGRACNDVFLIPL